MVPAKEPTVVNSEWLCLDPTRLLNNTFTSVENAGGNNLLLWFLFPFFVVVVPLSFCLLVYLFFSICMCKCVSGSEFRFNAGPDG